MQRNCSICNKLCKYKNYHHFKKALEKNSACNSCSNKLKFEQSGKKEKFIKLIEDGYSKLEIISILDISHGRYANLIATLKLKTNKLTSIKIVDKEKKLAQCSDCKSILSLNDFPITKKKTGYSFYKTYCYDCHYLKRNNHINSDINIFLSERYAHIKSAKKTKIFNISKEDFQQQYHNQNGLCFYTDLPMICLYGQGKQRDAISVDKIIPELGYIKGNVVFCLNRINMAKNDFSLEEIKKWMPGWYEKIILFLKQNH